MLDKNLVKIILLSWLKMTKAEPITISTEWLNKSKEYNKFKWLLNIVVIITIKNPNNENKLFKLLFFWNPLSYFNLNKYSNDPTENCQNLLWNEKKLVIYYLENKYKKIIHLIKIITSKLKLVIFY